MSDSTEENCPVQIPATYSRREERLPAVQQPTSLLQAITIAAANPAVDMDKVERLWKMHEQMVAREAEAAFNAAMARVQEKIQPVVRNAYNTHTQSGYAKLDAIHQMILPIYPKEGISISFDSAECPIAGWMRTIGLVSHAAGHTRQYHIDLPPDESGSQGKVNKTKVQAAGSTNEYARRYLTLMIFNVSTFDDKDGNTDKDKTEPDAEGKKALEACGSMKAFAVAWNALTKEQRKTLHKVRAECEARIKDADRAAQQ